MINVKARIRAYIKYNALTFPIIFAFYAPYQLLWIDLTGIQFVKWISTSALVGALFNLIFQPWITFIHKRGWVK